MMCNLAIHLRRIVLVIALVSLCHAPAAVASSEPYISGHGINFSVGNKYLAETDLNLSGPANTLLFKRTYNSQGTENGVMGYGWTITSGERLLIGTGSIILVQPGGRHIHFANTGPGVWVTRSGKTRTITATGTSYLLAEPDGTVLLFGSNGRLGEKTSANGYKVTYTYSGAFIASISDSFGKSISFTYNESNRLETLTTPLGDFIYGYDGNGNLTSVQKPDTTVKQYLYEDPFDNHNLTGVIDENGDRIQTLVYDAQDRVTSSELKGGMEKMTIAYPSDLQRIVTNSLGVATTYTLELKNGVYKVLSFVGPGCSACGANTGSDYVYDARQLINRVTDAKGTVTDYTYDGRGNRISTTEAVGTPDERTTTWTYEPNSDRVATISKASVNGTGTATTAMTYDPLGNLRTKTENGFAGAEPISRATSYTYDSFGRIQTIDGPRTDVSDITTFSYYPNTADQGHNRGNLHTITNALGHTTTYGNYTASGKAETITTPNGAIITTTHDGMGRVLTSSQGGLITTYAYYPSGELATVFLPDDSSITYTYTASGKPGTITDSLGNSITYTYNDAGQKIKEEVKDPQGVLQRRASYTYEETGDLDRTIRFDNTFEEMNYDMVGNVVARINARGDATSYGYDALNRLTQIIQPGSIATAYGYDRNDNPTEVTDPRGNATTYTYDDFGRKTSQGLPDTGLTVYQYDQADNLIATTDAKGQTAVYAYDALNRQTSAAYADGAEETSVYDSCPGGIGKLCTIQDASGATNWRYDSLGRVIGKTQVVTALNTTYSLSTGYAYNDAGQLRGITYPSGMAVTYEYAQGLIVGVSVNGQPVLSDVRYQPFGPVRSWTWGTGMPHERDYDQAGRLTRQSMGSDSRDLGYDPNGNVTEITDSSTNISYAYDGLDRLTNATGPAASIVYEYDDNGNRTLVSDGVNQYAPAYAPGSNRYVEGTSPAPELIPFADFTSGAFSYYGPEPGLESAFEEYANAHAGTCGTLNATVDPGINRISWAWTKCGSASAGYQQYLDWQVAGGDTTPQYDANGNILYDGVQVYGYDARNRLASVNGDFNNAYSYNALNQRLFKYGNYSQVAYFGYDEGGRLLGEYPGVGHMIEAQIIQEISYGSANKQTGLRFSYTGPESGLEYAMENYYNSASDGSCGTLDVTVGIWNNYITWTWSGCASPGSGTTTTISNTGRELIKEYVYLGDLPVAMVQNGVVYAIHGDHLGTPQKMTDPAGTVVWKASYAPYGDAAVNEDPDGNGKKVVLNLRFPGQYFDTETGLHYNWNRYYDPFTGRYISADPIGLEGGNNLYSYAENNPINYADPEGLTAWLVRLCGKGIKLVRKLGNKEAVDKAREGVAQIYVDGGRSEAKQLAKKASKGGKPSVDSGGHPPYNNPHTHPGPRPNRGGHIFYNIAAGMTFAHYFEGCGDCAGRKIAEAADWLNPLAIPKDVIDIIEGN